MFPSAFASLRSDPVSRAYYQRKRRILTLHAMIRNHTLYNPQPATKPPTAT